MGAFEAPAADRINEMVAFPWMVRRPIGYRRRASAVLARLWFVIVHVFEVGNGWGPGHVGEQPGRARCRKVTRSLCDRALYRMLTFQP